MKLLEPIARIPRTTSPLAILALILAAAISTNAKADTVGLPGANGGNNGDARGYYFLAPENFTITGLNVLYSSGTEYAELIDFGTSAPADYPNFTSSTAFTVLDYVSAAAGTTIVVDSPITSGDYIGVIGWSTGCGCTTYGSGSGYSTSIDGLPIDIYRLGTQQDLDTPAGSVFTEPVINSSNIGLTEITYNTAPVTSATPEPSSLALFGTGMAGMISIVRRRTRR